MKRRKGDPLLRWVIDPDSDCWLWVGATIKGYGELREGSTMVYAHRYFYERLDSPIPEGLTLDHLCRIPRCVNPDHLEPVTASENIKRGYKATKATCIAGHDLSDGPNLYVPPRGGRQCRTCRKLALRRLYARRRAAAAPDAVAGLRVLVVSP